jgi:hypothetical protein
MLIYCIVCTFGHKDFDVGRTHHQKALHSQTAPQSKQLLHSKACTHCCSIAWLTYVNVRDFS